jgi:DNA-binding transcriptional ArsR family regulator
VRAHQVCARESSITAPYPPHVALADPTRLGLAASLREGGELCVCDLAWISGRPQNLVSHHLRALKQERLATSRREGKIVFYSLTELGEELLTNVLDASASQAPIEAPR